MNAAVRTPMRRSLGWVAPVLLALPLASQPPAIAEARPETSPAHETGGFGLARAAQRLTPPPGGWQARRGVAENFTVVGHTALGGGGFNADVWAHRGYAYVGVWSGPTCPATGVKVADVRRANNPRLVARLQNPAGTSAEDVVVRRVDSARFSGDLAVVGIQSCDQDEHPNVFRGLQFFDVSDPRRPRELGRWWAGRQNHGCHEVDLVARADGRVLAGCANIFAEQTSGDDEVIVVDASNPRDPRAVGRFAIGADLGIDPATTPQNVGCGKASFAHSVRFTNRGRSLYASYWDYGTIRFDVSARGTLQFVNRTDIAPPDEDADNHSMTLAKGGRVQVINPEDFSPVACAPADAFDGWGEVHLATNDRGRTQHLATFSTPNSRSSRTDGFYSVHNTEVVNGDQAFSSWYSDGVVWWSLANARQPRMRGQFVPPPTEDPQRVFPPVPLVWGVYPDRASDLILASDINSGLWILRPAGLGRF